MAGQVPFGNKPNPVVNAMPMPQGAPAVSAAQGRSEPMGSVNYDEGSRYTRPDGSFGYSRTHEGYIDLQAQRERASPGSFVNREGNISLRTRGDGQPEADEWMPGEPRFAEFGGGRGNAPIPFYASANQIGSTNQIGGSNAVNGAFPTNEMPRLGAGGAAELYNADGTYNWNYLNSMSEFMRQGGTGPDINAGPSLQNDMMARASPEMRARIAQGYMPRPDELAPRQTGQVIGEPVRQGGMMGGGQVVGEPVRNPQTTTFNANTKPATTNYGAPAGGSGGVATQNWDTPEPINPNTIGGTNMIGGGSFDNTMYSQMKKPGQNYF